MSVEITQKARLSKRISKYALELGINVYPEEVERLNYEIKSIGVTEGVAFAAALIKFLLFVYENLFDDSGKFRIKLLQWPKVIKALTAFVLEICK